MFTETNEIIHVPFIWLLNQSCCWFPYIAIDNEEKSFSPSQITNMINKCVQPNEQDGKHYKVSILAGPFGKHGEKGKHWLIYITILNISDKLSKAKKVSQAWSEKESSDDSDNFENLQKTKKQPTPKKRKIITNSNFSLPKPPNSTVVKCEY